MVKEGCRVVCRFEEGLNKSFQSSVIQQLEQLVMDRRGVFEESSSPGVSHSLVVFLMNATTRVGEELGNKGITRFLNETTLQKKKVIIVFMRSGHPDPLPSAAIQLPDGCEWVEVNTGLKGLIDGDLTRAAIPRLRGVIQKECPHPYKDALLSTSMWCVMMMI